MKVHIGKDVTELPLQKNFMYFLLLEKLFPLLYKPNQEKWKNYFSKKKKSYSSNQTLSKLQILFHMSGQEVNNTMSWALIDNTIKHMPESCPYRAEGTNNFLLIKKLIYVELRA